MGSERLVIHGAREHNLKNVTLDLPRNQLIVFTGLSGSGKSSLAFDTIYAEGQRRYVESLSSYARQFLGQMEKPDVDFIEGLSPAISIDQKSTSRNPRSTVGTITEVYDYLRVLFARIGHPHCYNCGRPIGRQTPDQIVDQVLQLPEGTRFQVLAPVVRGRKGEYEKLLQELARKGFPRARIDGEVRELSEPIKLPKTYKHTIEVVVDRLVAKQGIRRRVADSIETALELAEGIASIAVMTHEGHEELQTFSQKLACTYCGLSFDELAPRNFSFNSPYGACPTCDGLGTRLEVDAELVVPDATLSINEGALAPWASNTLEYWYRVLEAVGEVHGFSLDTPWKKLPKRARDVVLYGSDEEIYVRYRNRYGRQRSYYTTYEGVLPNLERRYKETDSDAAREKLEQFMREIPCRACKGARLRPETLAVTVGGLHISQLTDLSIRKTLDFLDPLELSEREEMIAERLLKEIRARLGFLVDVGLDYLTLSRPARDPRRRGGAADPAGDPDRLGAGGCPLHPGRAVDRPASAGQPAAARHADPPPGSREHADRRRARRGDDRRGRPHRRHRAAGGGARRSDRLLGRPQGTARREGVAHGRVPLGQAVDPAADVAAEARSVASPRGRSSAQPEGHHGCGSRWASSSASPA